MIRSRIVTEMEFENADDFKRWLKSREVGVITGLADEHREALETGKPVTFTTPRPSIGAVTRSEITRSMPRKIRHEQISPSSCS